ncbi:hypothetical protein V9L05_18880 [Bernardetia sp. Wsw4-3y2]|uniref:hypothetical protein n=1 Tax=Bernardetia sp. Wsw4-3y2 TaxID=3127471 RepID=UPI0030D4A8A7
MEKTRENPLLRAINVELKKLEKKEKNLKEQINYNPLQIFIDARNEFREQNAEHINDDGTFKKSFWEKERLSEELKVLSELESKAFKYKSKENLFTKLAIVQLDIGDLTQEKFWTTQRANK